jgi:hypothetical protein
VPISRHNPQSTSHSHSLPAHNMSTSHHQKKHHRSRHRSRRARVQSKETQTSINDDTILSSSTVPTRTYPSSYPNRDTSQLILGSQSLNSHETGRNDVSDTRTTFSEINYIFTIDIARCIR